VEHPEASRSSISSRGILEIFAVSEKDRGEAERSRERRSGRREVSVLLKDDTGNDVPGGQIHEMQAVSNL